MILGNNINSAKFNSTLGTFASNVLTPVLNSAKDWLKSNQAEQRAIVEARTKGVNNPLSDYTGADLISDVKSAFQNPSAVDEAISEAVANAADSVDTNGASSTFSEVGPTRNSGISVSSASNGNPNFDYLNADLAKYYGMDKTAAYSEALQNTAYQRAVADLKAAGLNPVLAAGKVAGAGAFAAGDTLSGGSGSGSSGRRSGGNSGKYALSSDQYNLLGVAGTLIGGVIGLSTPGTVAQKLNNASSASSLAKTMFQSVAQGLSSMKY